MIIIYPVFRRRIKYFKKSQHRPLTSSLGMRGWEMSANLHIVCLYEKSFFSSSVDHFVWQCWCQVMSKMLYDKIRNTST
jgi:hypothetical protein